MRALRSWLVRFGLGALLGVTAQCTSSPGSVDCDVGAAGCACATGGVCLTGLSCFQGMCQALLEPDSEDSGDSQPTTSSEPTVASGSQSTTPGDPGSSDSATTIPDETTTETTLTTEAIDSSDTSSPQSDTSTSAALDTTTSDSIGTTSPGSTSESDSETTAPVADCGDGVVEGDEQCDDGNTVDADACSNACESNAPLLVFVDPVKKTMYGAEVGEPFDLQCDNGVGGLFGDVVPDAMLGLAASCKHFGLKKVDADYQITTSPTASLPYKGTMNGLTEASTCAANEVAIGYSISTHDFEWVDGLWIVCAKLSIENGVVKIGTKKNGPSIGNGDIYIGATCPAGTVIVGHHGYASNRLYGLGFWCAKPVAILE